MGFYGEDVPGGPHDCAFALCTAARAQLQNFPSDFRGVH